MTKVLSRAAIFAAARSIVLVHEKLVESDPGYDLAFEFDGSENLWDLASVIAECFEEWACENVDFDELEDVWPILLDENFGTALLLANEGRLDADTNSEDIAEFFPAIAARMGVKLIEKKDKPRFHVVPVYRTERAATSCDLDEANAWGVYERDEDGCSSHIADFGRQCDANDAAFTLNRALRD